MLLGENSQLGLDIILRKERRRIPSWLLNPMDSRIIEKYAGVQLGDYKDNPVEVYNQFQRNIGTCILDQYIPDNPLSMGDRGYEGVELGTTTGASEIIVDGMTIDSPESVVGHLERFGFPELIEACDTFDSEAYTQAVIDNHHQIQEGLGNNILKTPYGYARFPYLLYDLYGYVHYFSAYALFPEVIERHFSLQADYSEKVNRACVDAVKRAGLPPIWRLDHDMADSRSTLVDIKSLDKIWFGHFARSVQPLVDSEITVIWHCDGNLMEMVPRLLEVGIKGFQGFQYEDGMDYKNICSMKDRDGEDLFIIAGVSVTRTLPFGTSKNVADEMKFLVENGPKRSLVLGASSSITPGVSDKNIETFIEGLKYYRQNGRS